MTDKAPVFGELGWAVAIDHSTVNHREGEHVRGDVHTNTIEGFWGT